MGSENCVDYLRISMVVLFKRLKVTLSLIAYKFVFEFIVYVLSFVYLRNSNITMM